ncbi:2-succinyl-6-hydroxy-2,4-cyclohexadiene-1-carboxylate synthase [Ectothiorhodospira mobilis]|uniref:2-succinyl-6-hydroxy-2, 4-cyclohexadiene-1-carboxylate synthase n=1 Tax=Ectothiorhodospira mobilis TaxID=195064 RepID=UPI001EE83991|nr:2-succinyl-6-hydroxy-2,4-cyclohexadiene-1-carboxylate synthase [Ectothiorhodospira mobilis]MCG5536786.1 2-succinyl-6-hydroxy-2,4-cyclohexadiene-1-carboxylate synthase [Ectothiorhodospira mobilis]
MTAPQRISGTASGRPVVVCLHGFMGRGADWRAVAAALGDAFDCRLPDLPGHDGHLPPWLAEGADFHRYCRRTWEALVPDLPQRFVLAGYSMGGRIAAALALQHPGRIAALVLEGAHPGLTDTASRQTRRRQDAAWIRRFQQAPWPDLLQDWYRQPVFADLDAATRRRFIDARAGHDPHTLARVLEAAGLAGQPDLRPQLAALKAPVFYIAGEKDTRFSALGEDLAARCPGVTLVKLKGLGHNCHARAPEAVAGVLARAARATPTEIIHPDESP